MDNDSPPDDYAYHYAKFFDRSRRTFDIMSESFVRRLRYYGVPHPGDKVLEVGCGWGFCLGGLRAMGITDAEGYDVDPTAVEICRQWDLKASLVDTADIYAFMAQRPNTYDTILAFDVLEHIPLNDQGAALRDILLALKPGGVFVCQVPNADSIIASHMRYVDHTHHVTFTNISLDGVLHNAGFETARIIDADPPEARPPIREWRQLKWWMIKWFFRKVMRAVFVAELGARGGYAVMLDKNITAIARRPPGRGHQSLT